MRRAHGALAASALLAWPALAAAQASFTSQQRFVRATSESTALLWKQGTSPFPPNNDPPAATFIENGADETQSPGFGSFTASASSVAPAAVGPVVPDASAAASQTSSLAPSEVTASGSFSADADSESISPAQIAALNALLLPPIPYIGGFVQSSETAVTEFSVDFTLSEPTLYHLVGNVAHTPGTIGQVPHVAVGAASIELTGPSGSVASVSLSPVGGSEDLDVEGVLASGSYTLHADGSSGAFGRCDLVACVDPTLSGSFELRLTLAAAVVPGPSRAAAALLGLLLAASGAAALRRA
jgi:hypothetical protein